MAKNNIWGAIACASLLGMVNAQCPAWCTREDEFDSPADTESPTLGPQPATPFPTMPPTARMPTVSPRMPTRSPTGSPLAPGVAVVVSKECLCDTDAGDLGVGDAAKVGLGYLESNPTQANVQFIPAQAQSVVNTLSSRLTSAGTTAIGDKLVLAGLPRLGFESGSAAVSSASAVQTAFSVNAELTSTTVDTFRLGGGVGEQNIKNWKLSFQIWVITLFNEETLGQLNIAQVSAPRITIDGITYGRKADAQQATTSVKVDIKVCLVDHCAAEAAYVRQEPPTSAIALWNTALARPQRNVTLLEFQALLFVGRVVKSGTEQQNGLSISFRVEGIPTATKPGSFFPVPSDAVSFTVPILARWGEIGANKAVAKASYIYAVADLFTTPLNPNQFSNVMFRPPGADPYERRADAQQTTTQGDVSQDVTQAGFVPPTAGTTGITATADDDSSIIAVAIIVPITVIAIVLVIVWYMCCGGSEGDQQDGAPYGNKEEGEVKDPDETGGEIPEGDEADV